MRLFTRCTCGIFFSSILSSPFYLRLWHVLDVPDIKKHAKNDGKNEVDPVLLFYLVARLPDSFHFFSFLYLLWFFFLSSSSPMVYSCLVGN